MTTTDMVATSSRRRRRTGWSEESTTHQDLSSLHDEQVQLEQEDYFDDSDSDVPTEKSSHHHDEKMYNNACMLGQFMLNPCLCLVRCCGQVCTGSCWARLRPKPLPPGTVVRSKWKKGIPPHVKAMGWIDGVLIGGIVIVFLVSLCCVVPLTIHPGPESFHLRLSSLRPKTDDDVNRIPLLLPGWDYQRWNTDIGGWLFPHDFFYPTMELSVQKSLTSDYGGLEFVGPFGKPRVLRPDDQQVAEQYLESMRWPTFLVPAYDEHEEDVQDQPTTCRQQQWAQLYNPFCNAFHELDLQNDYEESHTGLGDDQMFDSFYINHGYWRDVWVVNEVIHDIKSILKMSRWEHPYDMEIFWYTLHDALVMERLTKSPRIVDIYGHCGYSVWVEAIPFEIENLVVPGDGMMKPGAINDVDALLSKNDFTDEEKLNMALSMAEAIADLHGFQDGLIVHDDIQLCQWLQTKGGQLKLGDFNRAEFPRFNTVEQSYCKYNNGHGYGNYRSPEEFAGNDLDEKIDIFSFGNNLYALLTGLWVFYENDDDTVVHDKLMKGETAFIDDRYRTQSFITSKLVEVMEKCWAFDPKDRIDIFQAVKILRQVKAVQMRRKQLNNPSK